MVSNIRSGIFSWNPSPSSIKSDPKSNQAVQARPSDKVFLKNTKIEPSKYSAIWPTPSTNVSEQAKNPWYKNPKIIGLGALAAAALAVMFIPNHQPSKFEGVISYPDGSTFEGWIKNGIPQGQGILTNSDGSKYVGNFWDGKFDGQGILTRSDGSKYEGRFHHGKFEGPGILEIDGSKWDCWFENGECEHGTLTDSKGTTYNCWFKNGECDHGTITDFNGESKSGWFIDGQIVDSYIVLSLDGSELKNSLENSTLARFEDHFILIGPQADDLNYQGSVKDGALIRTINDHIDLIKLMTLDEKYEGSAKNCRVKANLFMRCPSTPTSPYNPSKYKTAPPPGRSTTTASNKHLDQLTKDWAEFSKHYDNTCDKDIHCEDGLNGLFCQIQWSDELRRRKAAAFKDWWLEKQNSRSVPPLLPNRVFPQ